MTACGAYKVKLLWQSHTTPAECQINWRHDVCALSLFRLDLFDVRHSWCGHTGELYLRGYRGILDLPCRTTKLGQNCPVHICRFVAGGGAGGGGQISRCSAWPGRAGTNTRWRVCCKWVPSCPAADPPSDIGCHGAMVLGKETWLLLLSLWLCILYDFILTL